MEKTYINKEEKMEPMRSASHQLRNEDEGKSHESLGSLIDRTKHINDEGANILKRSK